MSSASCVVPCCLPSSSPFPHPLLSLSLRLQVPYTMAKFAVQGRAADAIYASMGKTPKELSNGVNTGVSLASGVVAGVVAAVISHPADTLLSKINKAGAGGSGSTTTVRRSIRHSGVRSASRHSVPAVRLWL